MTKKLYIVKNHKKNKRNIELLPNINANENAFDNFSFLKSSYLMKIKLIKMAPFTCHYLPYPKTIKNKNSKQANFLL